MKVWVFLVSFLFATNVYAEPERVTLPSLIDQFNSVVFVNEHGAKGREPKPLVKWQGPIIYSPAGRLTKDQVEKFFALMNRIKLLTGLNMRMAGKGDKSNLIINFVPQAELAKMVAPGINCFGKLKGNRHFVITSAFAYIPADRPDKADHCLVEETVQLFGLTNDSTILTNSMFHEDSKRTSLSVSDQILLKALYDDRLHPGIKKEEAQPIVKVVIQDILDKATKRRNSQ